MEYAALHLAKAFIRQMADIIPYDKNMVDAPGIIEFNIEARRMHYARLSLKKNLPDAVYTFEMAPHFQTDLFDLGDGRSVRIRHYYGSQAGRIAILDKGVPNES